MKSKINDILLKLQNNELCVGDASNELEKLLNKKNKTSKFPFSDTPSYEEKLIESEIGFLEGKLKREIEQLKNDLDKFKEVVFKNDHEIRQSISEIKSKTEKLEREDEIQLKEEGKNKMKTIPKVYKHQLAKLHEGVGSGNPKEYCNCDSCHTLKERRNSIYNKWYHRLNRWFNKNF